MLAAVGPLQFEVVQYRLQSEYGAESRLETAPWTLARWLPVDLGAEATAALKLPTGVRLAYDAAELPVLLFPTEWAVGYFNQTNPGVILTDLPPR